MSLNPDLPPVSRASNEMEVKGHHEVVQSALGEIVDMVEELNPTGRMIFLGGGSTSGKSSIMTAFTKSPNTVELGIDDFAAARFPKVFEKTLPSDYEKCTKVLKDKDIEKLFVPGGGVDWVLANCQLKENCTDSEIEALKDLCVSDGFGERLNSQLFVRLEGSREEQVAHFSEILKQVKSGKTVIFDTPEVDAFYKFLAENKLKASVQRVLVYLPVGTLAERVSGRNEAAIKNANLLNYRPLIHALDQFKNHYRPASEGDVVVDTLERSDIAALFKRYGEAITAENKKAAESGRPQITPETMLDHFGLSDAESVKITSTHLGFHQILNTALQSSEECALELTSRSFRSMN